MLRFTATHANNALAHSQQRIHGRSITVQLVQNNITSVHHALILGKWNSLCHYQFHLAGILLFQPLGGTHHYVRSLVLRTMFTDSYKNLQRQSFPAASNRIGSWYGERDVCCLVLQCPIICQPIRYPIFIQTSHYGLGPIGHIPAKTLCRSTYPNVCIGLCNSIGSYLVPYIEITVTHGTQVTVHLGPIVIHAKCS